MTHVAMPYDRQYLQDRFWTPEQAADAWGCSLATAYRLITKHAEEVGRRVIACVWDQGDTRYLTVISKGSRRPSSPRGNPAFTNSQWQSAIARCREARKRGKSSK